MVLQTRELRMLRQVSRQFYENQKHNVLSRIPSWNLTYLTRLLFTFKPIACIWAEEGTRVQTWRQFALSKIRNGPIRSYVVLNYTDLHVFVPQFIDKYCYGVQRIVLILYSRHTETKTQPNAVLNFFFLVSDSAYLPAAWHEGLVGSGRWGDWSLPTSQFDDVMVTTNQDCGIRRLQTSLQNLLQKSGVLAAHQY